MNNYTIKLLSKHEINFKALNEGYVFPYFSVLEARRILKTFFIQDHVINVNIRPEGSNIVHLTFGCSREIPDNIQSTLISWINHILDLDNDYSEVINRLKELSEEISLDLSSTLVIPFVHSPDEMLLTALLSQNTTAEFYRKMRHCLAQNFGQKLMIDNLETYSFPTVQNLLKNRPSEIKACKIGYRAKTLPNLLDFLEKYPSERLAQLDNNTLLKILTNIKGIGDYSARCFLIYHLKRFNVVFLDSWVRTVIYNLFGLPKNVSIKEFTKFAEEKFAPNPALILDYLLADFAKKKSN